MRADLIIKFCEGVKPKQLIKKRQGGLVPDDEGENRTTVYKYHAIYKQMKRSMQSDAFINQMIKVMINLKGKKV